MGKTGNKRGRGSEQTTCVRDRAEGEKDNRQNIAMAKNQVVYLGDLQGANLAGEDDFCRNIMGCEA